MGSHGGGVPEEWAPDRVVARPGATISILEGLLAGSNPAFRGTIEIADDRTEYFPAEIHVFPNLALAPCFAPLLEYASLRGSQCMASVATSGPF